MKCLECGANSRIDHARNCSIVSKATDKPDNELFKIENGNVVVKKPIIVFVDECSEMSEKEWAAAGELAHNNAAEYFAKKRLLP